MKTLPETQTLRLPEDLHAHFQAVELKLWRMDTVIAVCGALCGLVLSFLLLFVSDRLWDTPPWLRTVFTVTGLAILAYFVWGWFRLWVWKRRDYRALAQLVQGRFRRLGDRLLGIVELADEGHRPPDISPALCRAAIQQVSNEAVQFDFREAVATRKPKILFLAAVAFAVLLLLPWALVPQATRNALARWLLPAASVPRYTFVTLDQLPERMVVAHGEPFDIEFGVQARALWKHPTARAQFEQQTPLEMPVRDGKAAFRIPGQTKAGLLALRVGDVSRRIGIEPVHRPALKRLLAQIQWPDYLQHPAAEEDVRSGVLSVLEGSQVVFKGTATRALTAATFRWQTNDAKPEALAVRREEFASRPLSLDGRSGGAFEWRDEFGLAAATAWPITLQTKSDEAPSAECPEQAAALAVLEDEVLDIKLAASDDFGLQTLGVVWDCRKRSETNAAATQDLTLTNGGPQVKALSVSYRFSPSLLHLPPDSVVTLRAVASDYFPGRRRSESSAHQIFVMSREEHAQLIQQQFERMASELEDVTRREEALEEAARETRELSPEKLAGEEGAKRIEEQAAEQKEIAEKTAELARKTSETLREALRNKAIDQESLKEWSQHMQTMQRLAQQQMPQASKSLQSAQANPSQRERQMEQAMQQEQEIVKELQEMQRNVGKTLDQMMANTLAQRLRKVAGTQNDTGQGIRRHINDSIGLKPERLPAALRDRGKALGFGQDGASKEALALTDEISRFFDRTSITNYGQVASEMRDTEASGSLAKNAELIRKNIGVQAMAQTTLWAKRFKDWAEAIDKAREEAAQCNKSGGGNCPIPEEALKRLLALLRLRMEEMNLRDQTQWLEEHGRKRSSYREDGVNLSIRQSLLMDDVYALDNGSSRFLPKAHEAMKDAETELKKPHTGKKTVDAETDAVNLLEAEVMSMMKSCDNPQQASAMQAMMDMMGMRMGQQPTGTGSYAGGEAAPSDADVNGNAKGATGNTRQTEKTVGRESRVLPVEYREALQQYYKAVEQLNP